jgi:hypothetical protein
MLTQGHVAVCADDDKIEDFDAEKFSRPHEEAGNLNV